MRPMEKRLKINDTHCHCIECGAITQRIEVNAAGYCIKCYSATARKHTERKLVQKERTILNATRQLTDQIAQARKASAISPEFFDELAKELGGARGIAESIAKDIKRLHGEGLSEAERKYHTFDDKTIQRYWQSLMQFMQQQDKNNAVDISSLSDKELQATLLSLAKALINEDQEFRRHAIRITALSDKDFLDELIAEANATVEGKVAEKPKIEKPAKESVHNADEYEVDVSSPGEEE